MQIAGFLFSAVPAAISIFGVWCFLAPRLFRLSEAKRQKSRNTEHVCHPHRLALVMLVRLYRANQHRNANSEQQRNG